MLQHGLPGRFIVYVNKRKHDVMNTTGIKVTLLALAVSYSCALQAKNVSLGDTAVATGQHSTAVGQGSMALGNNMTAEQAQATMKAQNALLQNKAQAHEQYTQAQALFDSKSLANSNILERQEAMKPLLQQQAALAGQRTAQQQQVTQAQQAADRMAQIYERNLGAVSQIVDADFVELWQQGQADRLAQEVKKGLSRIRRSIMTRSFMSVMSMPILKRKPEVPWLMKPSKKKPAPGLRPIIRAWPCPWY